MKVLPCFRSSLALLFTGLMLGHFLPLPAGAAEWQAGVASTMVTPDTEMWMAGYAARNKPVEGRAQDLFAKALAIEDGQGGRLVIVTLDLIGVPRTLRKAVEKRVAEAHGLRPDQLLINASHTHCGPEFRAGRGPLDDIENLRARQGAAYHAALEEKLFKLVGTALQALAPAKLTYSHARCGFAMNRRLPADGTFRNSPYADGPVDHDVPVLRMESADGRVLRAVLFGYACHNTTLSFYNWCGDYAGFAQEYLEAAHPGTVAMFVTGCGGDQNPYPRGTLELAQQHGRTLATAVEAALIANATTLTGPLQSAGAEIPLRYAPAPSREELHRRLGSKDRYEVLHAQRLLERMDKGEPIPAEYPYPVQVVRFGGALTLVALGGEVVVDYSLRLKRELAGPAVWVAGYCNDVMGYIASERVLKEGGYEGGGAMKHSSSHPGPWAPGLEEQIVSKVHELHRSIHVR